MNKLRIALFSFLVIVLAGCEEKPQDSTTVLEADSATQDNSGNIHAIVSYLGQPAELPDSALVYVFAREPGKTMPLAVERFSPTQLPMQVAFAQPENAVDTIEIVARMSITGAVQKLNGDQQIVSVPLTFSATTQALKLEIPNANAIDPFQTDGALAVEVSVILLDELALPATTSIFISAREPSGFPVAVRKLSVGDLPTTIRLTDADSMFKVNTLSQHKVVTLVARASLSGKPTASIGDWEVVSGPVTVPNLEGPIELKIGTQIKLL